MRCYIIISLMTLKKSFSFASQSLLSTHTTKLQSSVSSDLQLAQFLTGKSHITVLTGAGVSTDSGIPDYRGENGSYKKGHKPMVHHEFMTKENNRRRYVSTYHLLIV
jgi:Sir2 family